MQVHTVTLTSCPVDYRRAVLAALGGQLLRLKLDNCLELDLTDLKICNRLKELEFNFGCEFLPLSVKAEEPFLPCLQKLRLDDILRCVGLTSRFFETVKPSLTELRLSCAHFGVREASEFDWGDLPLLFPNLKLFEFCAPSKSLTLEKVRDLVPRLHNLETLRIPYGTLCVPEEIEEANRFIDELQQRSSSIDLEFQEDNGECYYNPRPQEEDED